MFFSSSLFLPQLLGDRRLGQRHARTTRQLKQVDGKRPYIAASFKPSTMPPSFTLGNQMVYSGFENRALDPGQEYVFFILAELNITGGVSEISLFNYTSWCSYF